MEFVKTSHFIQTEMHLKVMNSTKSVNHHVECDENFDEASTSDAIRIQSSSTSSSTSSSLAVPDHTTLIMPIHQKICHILIDFLTQTNHNYHSCVSNDDNNFRHDTTSTFTSSSSTALTAPTVAVVRIALIGAGCCAIPAYLLSTHSQRDTDNQQHPHQHQQYLRFSIDAIEPEAEILDIATKYFGINFDNTYLTKYVMDGLSFLKAAISVGKIKSSSSSSVPSSSYDVIVVDAFSNQCNVENHFATSSSQHIKGKLLCT
jgi:hypothetical protein